MVLQERLWNLYVQTSALFGIGLMTLSKRQCDQLDGIQRMSARTLLRFTVRSPTPATLLELGWNSWSSHQQVESARLLARVACQPNDITSAILKALSTASSSTHRPPTLSGCYTKPVPTITCGRTGQLGGRKPGTLESTARSTTASRPLRRAGKLGGF